MTDIKKWSIKRSSVVNTEGFHTTIDTVQAQTERNALCEFLKRHENIGNVMLWFCEIDKTWKLTECDNDCEFYLAEEEFI